MKNELIGYMYKGIVGDNDMYTITHTDDGIKAERANGNVRIFASENDAVRTLHDEGYISPCRLLEIMYIGYWR